MLGKSKSLLACAALGSVALAGCTAMVDGKGYGSNATASGSSGNGNVGAGSGSGTSTECESAKPVAQRLVRLTFAEYENTVTSILGADSLMGASVEDPRRREFQALFVEGDLVNTQVLQQTVSLGETASNSLSTNLDSVTGCTPGAEDDACANKYLLQLAQQIYRRPLTADEQTSIAQLYTDTKTAQGTVVDGLRSAILGVLTAPASLCRTEFGTPNKDGKTATLTAYEMASALSYFLLDGPPDSDLLAAAAADKLTAPADVTKQIDRLLATDAVKQNLTAVMVAYFGLKDLDGTTKDPQLYPDFTVGVRNSMYTETQLFIQDTLWNGKVDDLMTSRKSFVNDTLAKYYGVKYPAASGTDFLPFEFSAGQRAGILTHGSVMSMRARTDTTSVVSRGLFINGTVLCVQSPPPPPASVAAQVQAQLSDTTATERDKAHYRDTTAPCNGCHLGFDPYGLVLESYDSIGRLRTSYSNGSAIDTTGVLPAAAGGGTVADVTAFVNQITTNGRFAECMTSNMMKYALTDASLVDIDDCNVKKASDAFAASGHTFPEMVREIAASDLISTRVIE